MKIASINFKSLLSVLLIIVLVSSFIGCSSEDIPLNSSEAESTASEESKVSEESASAAVSSEEISKDDSSTDTSTEEPSQTPSEEPTNEPSSEATPSEEPSSEEPSEEPSEDVSEESFPPVTGKVVAFTFDDGPSYTVNGSNATTTILDKLEELNMKATFFVVGERVTAQNQANLQRMVSLGCAIGNHSYDHPNFNQLSFEKVSDQIQKTNALIKQYAGVTCTLLRPPYGNLKRDYASQLGMTVICWDVDSLDWELRNAQKIYDRTLPMIKSGSIVLMHDIYNTTAEAFCMLADELVKQGYTLVSIPELLGSENLKNTSIYYGFEKIPS